jgi:hypothetical protein
MVLHGVYVLIRTVGLLSGLNMILHSGRWCMCSSFVNKYRCISWPSFGPDVCSNANWNLDCVGGAAAQHVDFFFRVTS